MLQFQKKKVNCLRFNLIGKDLPQSAIHFETWRLNPANIYLFKVNNRNTRTMCEMCSGVSIVDFESVNTDWLKQFSRDRSEATAKTPNVIIGFY